MDAPARAAGLTGGLQVLGFRSLPGRLSAQPLAFEKLGLLSGVGPEVVSPEFPSAQQAVRLRAEGRGSVFGRCRRGWKNASAVDLVALEAGPHR